MPRAAATKDYRTFVAGLITEATGLSYPENSARDLDNVNLDRTGAVTRRRGIDVKTGEAFWDGTTSTDNLGIAVTTHLWDNVANLGELTFTVVQSGSILKVFDTSTNPYTEIASFDLQTELSYVAPIDAPYQGDGAGAQPQFRPTSGFIVEQAPLQSAVGRGRIWFTHESSVPFYLEYDTDTSIVWLRPVGYAPKFPFGRLGIRDFSGIDDGLAIPESISTLSTEHRHNLYNQGWTNFSISAFLSVDGLYPSNSYSPWVARSGGGFDFRATRTDFGNSPAPKGRAIINPLSGSRDELWGGSAALTQTDFSGVYDEPSSLFFQTVEFFAGRLWLSGDANNKRSSGVYFSQILNNEEDAGKFYQRNDPTSEEITDLLANDGGVIYINDAGRINKLVAFGEGILVLSERGIWFVRGDEGGFKATAYSVDKISDAGCNSPFSVVRTDNGIVYWNPAGVYSVTFENLRPTIQNITDDRIQNFFQNISDESKKTAYGVFDSIERRIVWLYKFSPSLIAPPQNVSGRYDRALLLDLRLGAFFKHSFPVLTTGGRTYAVSSIVPFRASLLANQNDDVLRGVDEVLVGAEQVVISELVTLATASPNGIDYLLSSFPSNVATPVQHAWADIFQTTFKDFQTINTTGINYTSYLETGDEILDDLSRYKQATYVHSFFNKTETAITDDSPLTFDFPSACTMQMRWDWHGSNNGGRWSTPQTAYRFRRPLESTAVGALDTGERIVYTKLKARGVGRAMSIRYESEEGKDFQLLGFSINATSNGVP